MAGPAWCAPKARVTAPQRYAQRSRDDGSGVAGTYIVPDSFGRLQMEGAARGSTLVELLVVLTLLGIVAAMAVPRTVAVIDRFSVRAASQDVVLALTAARAAATRRGAYTAFVADPRAGRVRVVSGGETLFLREIARTRGVRLNATRESITFAPTGMGWGAANTTIVVSRGGRADTVVTSRLGRVRRN